MLLPLQIRKTTMLMLQINMMIKMTVIRNRINSNRINSSNSNINRITRIKKAGAVIVILEEVTIIRVQIIGIQTSHIIKIKQIAIIIIIIINPANNMIIRIILIMILGANIVTPTKAVGITTIGKIITQIITSNRRTGVEEDQEDKEALIANIGK